MNTWQNSHSFYTGSSSVAWPCVVVKRGSTVVKNSTIVKCNWSNKIGVVLEKLGPD